MSTNAIPAGSDDGLAVEFPAPAPLGTGKDRALVLGGGGEYLAAWMLGFAHGLNELGVPYQTPDVVLGTSAGSVVGSTFAGGHLRRLTREFDFFERFPKLMSDLVPTPESSPSQARALELCASASDASVETIQGIGRAAIAACNPDVSKLQKLVGLLTGNTSWPSPTFHAVTVDCYTGERLVLSESSGVPISQAVVASMSIPGVVGPTWVRDRLCMDGGISVSSTHCDLVHGAKRAIVVSLSDGAPEHLARFSGIPNLIQQELADLKASGTATLFLAVNPGHVELMSPEAIGSALKLGYQRATTEADRVRAFWA